MDKIVIKGIKSAVEGIPISSKPREGVGFIMKERPIVAVKN
jgi:hypothetical protein